MMDLNALEVCGCVLIGYVSIKTFYTVADYLWRSIRCRDHLKRLQKPNDYAVVTGSTDGIGLEYARQLAARGFNILLLSRNENKLTTVANELNEEHPNIKVDRLAVDFSKLDIYDRIAAKISALDGPVSVLVNNVGITHNLPEYLYKMPANVNRDMIITNCVSCTLMTELVAKSMTTLRRGAIIFVSSFSGDTNFPLLSTYSASKYIGRNNNICNSNVYSSAKAFENSLADSMAKELEESNILVQVVTPNQVRTKASRDLYTSFLSIEAKDFVRYSLNSVGHETKTSAHPWHKFLNSSTTLFNQMVGERIAAAVKFNSTKHLLEEHNKKINKVH